MCSKTLPFMLGLAIGTACPQAQTDPERQVPPAVRADRAVKRLELPAERGRAMMELWRAGPDAVPALVRAVRDPRDEVVAAACAVLYELGLEGAHARVHLERRLAGAEGSTARALRWALHGVTSRRLILAEWGTSKLTLLDDKGAATGKVDGLASPWDVQSLPGGHFLVTEVSTQRVREIDEHGKTLWTVKNLNNPNRARRLCNGNTVIADYNKQRVVEVDPAGKTVWQHKGVKPTYVQRLLSGNTLIVDKSTNKLVEIDPAGKVVATLALPKEVYWAQRLRNGNTLVADRGAGCVIELDPKGGEVSKLTGLSSPNACLRLADGSTVVSGAKGVVAFDRNGVKLWERESQWVGGLSR